MFSTQGVSEPPKEGEPSLPKRAVSPLELILDRTYHVVAPPVASILGSPVSPVSTKSRLWLRSGLCDEQACTAATREHVRSALTGKPGHHSTATPDALTHRRLSVCRPWLFRWRTTTIHQPKSHPTTNPPNCRRCQSPKTTYLPVYFRRLVGQDLLAASRLCTMSLAMAFSTSRAAAKTRTRRPRHPWQRRCMRART